MSAFQMKEGKKDFYNGKLREYIEVGPPNKCHYIGFCDPENKWLISDGKKKLFAAMM
jgi:hypothetical protein